MSGLNSPAYLLVQWSWQALSEHSPLACLPHAGWSIPSIAHHSALRIERGGNFDPHGVAVLRLRPKLLQYPPARSQAFVKDVVRRLEALPGVESVTFARGIGPVWQSCCLTYLPDRGKEAMRAGSHVIAPR